MRRRSYAVWWNEGDGARHAGKLELGPLHASLARIGERHDSTSAQVALAWLLRRPAVTGTIVGIRNAQEAEQLPGAAALRLAPDELREIETAAP